MKKVEADYIDEYGEIPRDRTERFIWLLEKLNLRNSPSRKNIQSSIERNLNIRWKKINFIIYLLPKGTPRPRLSSRSRTFYVLGARDNREIFDKFMANQDFPIITTPCKFKCASYLPIPKQFTKIDTLLAEMGLIRPINRPDWDNLGKTYSDMIQGTLLYEDSLIIEGTSKKFYSIKPRIEIELEYADEHDSMYNYNKMRKKVD
jgi:Holliday junction resolvase RusA-like endonuclease